MKLRIHFERIAFAAFALAVSSPDAKALAADANKACALVTPAELEAALGEKVTLKPQSGTGSVAMCTGTSPKANVLLRVAAKREGSGDAAKAGVEMMRKQGYQVDVKMFGPITCSTMEPPANLAGHGFNTTCSVTKGTLVAAIEVTAKAKADVIPIERLKPVAEKMAGRF
jgi:hypothetical protein